MPDFAQREGANEDENHKWVLLTILGLLLLGYGWINAWDVRIKHLVGDMGGMFVMTVVISLVFFYFLPSVSADVRNVQHAAAIALINLFFGWTVLGWLAALIWAVVEKVQEPEQEVKQLPRPRGSKAVARVVGGKIIPYDV